MRGKKTVWIDLDNSPHIPFFSPIIKELQRRGYKVVISVRNYAQTIGLAELTGLDYTPLGRHYGKNIFLKSIGLVIRTIQMIPFYLKHRPTISVSHGSRSQILFSRMVGLANAIAVDYEFVKFFPFLKSPLGIMPEVIPEAFRRKYFRKVSTYPGIKEDVYVHNFSPDPHFLSKLSMKDHEKLVTIRPPATWAHYHNEKSDVLFKTLMDHICNQDQVQIILLPRTKKQGLEIAKKYLSEFNQDKIMIPDQVLDGLNLIWHSDLVVSAGGTMIREAAALNVPAVSIFGGQVGSVDQYLQNQGKLKVIKDKTEITKVSINKRQRPENPDQIDKKVMNTIVDHLESLLNGV